MAARSLVGGFASQLSFRRQSLLRKAARAPVTQQPVSGLHTVQQDLELEAIGLSNPEQQQTRRAKILTSRPLKEIRYRRQMWFRGMRAATADNKA